MSQLELFPAPKKPLVLEYRLEIFQARGGWCYDWCGRGMPDSFQYSNCECAACLMRFFGLTDQDVYCVVYHSPYSPWHGLVSYAVP